MRKGQHGNASCYRGAINPNTKMMGIRDCLAEIVVAVRNDRGLFEHALRCYHQGPLSAGRRQLADL